MGYRKLSDGQWEMLEHLVPKQEMGRPRSRDREMLDAILYVLHTGCRWEELPKEFPPKSSVHSRFRVWAKTGFFKQVLRTLGRHLAPSQVFHLDSTLKAAKKGRQSGTGQAGQRQQNKPRGERSRIAYCS
jgi:transposase